jgi:hypothetical protein
MVQDEANTCLSDTVFVCQRLLRIPASHRVQPDIENLGMTQPASLGIDGQIPIKDGIETTFEYFRPLV